MSSSSYLDNLMRHGASAHNARVAFTGTNVTVSEYGGTAFTSANPLLIRFSSSEVSVVTSGSASHDFSTATWGAAAYDGYYALFVGLQRLSDSSVQVCVGVSPEPGSVTTVLNTNATHSYYIAAPTAATGKIVWVGVIHNVLRENSAWVTTDAFVEEI